MTREEKFRELWTLLSQYGFGINNGLDVSAFQVELSHEYGYDQYEVMKIYVEEEDTDSIRYETERWHGQNLYFHYDRGLDSVECIYDRLKELGLLKKLDKNLF